MRYAPGGSISPLLANVYLHYVLDLWADQWRRTQTRNDAIIVRYANDVRYGFQTRADAVRFQNALRQRLRTFGLELHEEKTRLIEVGRFAAERRKRRAEGKPETFGFLGFTHYCGQTRGGKFVGVRKTMKKKVQAKLPALKGDLRHRMHDPVPEVAVWLSSVKPGHFQYYGVPFNAQALSAFRQSEEGDIECWLDTHLAKLTLRKHKRGERPPYGAFVFGLPKRALKRFPMPVEYDARGALVGVTILRPIPPKRRRQRRGRGQRGNRGS